MNNLEYLKDVEGKYRDAKSQFELQLNNIVDEKEIIFRDGNYCNESIREAITNTLTRMRNSIDEMTKCDSVIRATSYLYYERFYKDFFEDLELLERLL